MADENRGEPYKQNDTWPPLDLQLTDKDDNPIDVSGDVSLTLIRRLVGTSSAGTRFALTKLSGGTDGWVRRTWTTGDHAQVGDYECEVERDKDGTPGGIETVPNEKARNYLYKVDDDLD